jgi:hypothetical protein
MNVIPRLPENTKPVFWSFVIGGIVTMFLGFNFFGWMLESTAKQMASEQSMAQVVKALSPICLEQAKRDPKYKEQLVALEKESSWSRGAFVEKTGWANVPGIEKPYSGVADACAEQLSKSFTPPK